MAIDNLKEHNDKNNIVGKDKNNKYLTIIFTSEYQKFMYTEKIFKKIDKDINKNYVKIKLESNDNVPLNILVNIHTLLLLVRYQRVYINTCWYNEFYEKVQV